MRKVELQCLIVGAAFRDYPDLANHLRQLGAQTHFKQISSNSVKLKLTLKHLQGASLIFVPDSLFSSSSSQTHRPSHPKDSHSNDSLRAFADLIWQYASDAIIVVLDKKPSDDTFSTYLNDVQISRLHFTKGSKASTLQLQFLAQTALLKYDFRCCKRLLGISEKRTQWLVDSSVIPVAYISHDLHLHANSAYLNLLGIQSNKALRTLSVKDFITKQEHHSFDSFIGSQLKRPKELHSLFLQMQKKNGAQFRANVRVIPSVYKDKRCLQLWVNALETQIKPLTEVEKLWGSASPLINQEPLAELEPSAGLEPSENLKSAPSLERNTIRNVVKKPKKQQDALVKRINPNLILKEILKRKEAKIVTHELRTLNKPKKQKDTLKHHYLVSLKVPYVQRHAVDDLLMKASYHNILTQRALFWDKVKLTRLFQIMIKRDAKNLRLLVRLSEASLQNKHQIIWLQKCLAKLGAKSSMIVFMLPSRLDESSQKKVVGCINAFKSYGCQFAFDDFFVNSLSLSLLKHCKPQALRLYLPWLQAIEGDKKREVALARLIRQMESRNIRIIVPCGFSQDMNRLFILSGASFCQEKGR